MKNITITLFTLLAAVFFIGCGNPQAGDASTGAVSTGHATVEITEANFEELVLNSNQPVLLDFWASWCGPCLQLGPTIEELAAEYKGSVLIGKVNVDEQSNIAARYKINGIPALLYFNHGELVTQQVGVQPRSNISDQLDAMLQ